METEQRLNALVACGLMPRAPITVVVGHYGVGKTNFSLNLALDWAAQGVAVTLMDMDVVNPYFRSSDYHAQLEEAGVRVISPLMAGTNLDSPSLSGAVSGALEETARWYEKFNASENHDALASGTTPTQALLIDAGGDDVGATALGRFASAVARVPYEMLYVVNQYRNLTQEPSEAVSLLAEIEKKAKLQASGVVNNSHLKEFTDEQVVLDALPFAEQVSELLGLPLLCTTVPEGCIDRENTLFGKSEGRQKFYPVRVYVRTPWE